MINTNVSALLSSMCTVNAPTKDRGAADLTSSAHEEGKKQKRNLN